jgi:fructose-1,6-bisphosphatase/inositol monophosphatase family enzyme
MIGSQGCIAGEISELGVLTEVEQAAIEGHFGASRLEGSSGVDVEEGAVLLGLRLMLEAGRSVRERRTIRDRSGVIVKDDGSPATSIEKAIELRLRELLASFDTQAVVVGEETGGSLPDRGLAVAIDPIDGTRAFLSETETYSTTFALIRNRETVLGMISNPVTGEIAYATADGSSRLVRLSLFGEPNEACFLPATTAEDGPILVNLHPSRTAKGVMRSLYGAWARGDISMVRSPGGSPAWALVEAARGHFVYVNLWSEQAASAYDLAAGAMIVRRAGGEVVDLAGKPIDALGHAGAFIAGLDPQTTSRVGDLVREGMEVSPKD